MLTRGCCVPPRQLRWGVGFLQRNELELFFGLFFGPLFLHGFGGFLFGFFACVLAFAHGCAPCVVSCTAFFIVPFGGEW